MTVVAYPYRARAWWGDVAVAESDSCLCLETDGAPSVLWFPEADMELSRLDEEGVRSICADPREDLASLRGYRAFDDVALAAVEKALAGHVPGGAVAHAGEVRTLWQLDATAYVVVSPEPELVFDESSGKHEWRYPLQKRVDHHVRLVAVY